MYFVCHLCGLTKEFVYSHSHAWVIGCQVPQILFVSINLNILKMHISKAYGELEFQAFLSLVFTLLWKKIIQVGLNIENAKILH